MSLRLDHDVEARLRQIAGNNICVDCDSKGPQWASVSFGIFMCLECSGRHRSLGVHISFVRSVTMDSWSEKQIRTMEFSGNDKFNNFLAENKTPKTTPIHNKYITYGARLYKVRLDAELEGREPPMSIAQEETTGTPQVSQSSELLPGETEAEYIVRQRKIQEEARERMRKKFGSSGGLSGSSRMAGIGSSGMGGGGGGGGGGDRSTPASYLSGQDGLGLNVDLDAVQKTVSDGAQKAYSFVSSVTSTGMSVLGTQLEKAKSLTQTYYQDPNQDPNKVNDAHSNLDNNSNPNQDDPNASGSNAADSWLPPSILNTVANTLSTASSTVSSSVSGINQDSVQETVYKGWSSLSSSALSFWETASTATLSTVNQIGESFNANPADVTGGNNSNSSNSNSNRNSNSSQAGKTAKSSKSAGWGDESEDEEFEAALNNVSIDSSSDASPTASPSTSSDSSHNNNNNSSSSSSSSSKASASAKTATQADFFTSFGL